MGMTDLVMLDIKHIDPEKHRELTEQPNDNILKFAEYLSEKHGSIMYDGSMRVPPFMSQVSGL